jgi:hypothetical protein
MAKRSKRVIERETGSQKEGKKHEQANCEEIYE